MKEVLKKEFRGSTKIVKNKIPHMGNTVSLDVCG